ncbi:MAG: hypothetical protein U0Q07_01655 [Acidimicrobiales bacterium]
MDPDTAPPEHLSAAAGALWRLVLDEYELTPVDVEVLRLALEALDRADEARRLVDADGAVVLDRFGQHRVHPGVAVERDARLAYARLVRQLDLDGLPDPAHRRK